MMMGMATTPAAAANAASGVPKRKPSRGETGVGKRSTSFPCQPVGEVTRQRDAKGGVGPQLHVVDVLVAAAALDFLEERLHLVEVALPQRAWVGQQFRVLFQPAKEGGLLEGELQFGAVQHVQDDDFMPFIPQVF